MKDPRDLAWIVGRTLGFFLIWATVFLIGRFMEELRRQGRLDRRAILVGAGPPFIIVTANFAQLPGVDTYRAALGIALWWIATRVAMRRLTARGPVVTGEGGDE